MTCDLITYLSGQSADSWTAFWTGALFFATVGLAIIAWVQIGAARTENRKTQTLLACGQYDTNQIIFDCHRALIAAKGDKAVNDAALVASAKRLRLEIITVLNFLDAIAIGISQGLYLDGLAKAHLESIVRRNVSELVESDVLKELDCERSVFAHLIEMDKRWRST